MGIYPCNNPPEVDAVLSVLNCPGDQKVPVPPFCYSPKPEGDYMTLREALMSYYDLKTVKMDLVKVLVESVTDDAEKAKGERLIKEGVSSYPQELTIGVLPTTLVGLPGLLIYHRWQ